MLRIEELRRAQNIGQKSLAQDLRVSQPTVSHWENGTKLPTLDNAIKLADIFDVSLDYLVGRNHDKGDTAPSVRLTAAEKRMLEIFRALNSDGQGIYMELGSSMVESGRYTKKHSPLVEEKA